MRSGCVYVVFGCLSGIINNGFVFDDYYIHTWSALGTCASFTCLLLTYIHSWSWTHLFTFYYGWMSVFYLGVVMSVLYMWYSFLVWVVFVNIYQLELGNYNTPFFESSEK